jgi:hypothetical protein
MDHDWVSFGLLDVLNRSEGHQFLDGGRKLGLCNLDSWFGSNTRLIGGFVTSRDFFRQGAAYRAG